MNEFSKMKRYLSWIMGALAFLSMRGVLAQTSSNTVKYQVTYDVVTQTYTAWAVPDYSTPNGNNSGSNELVSTAQFTLKVPIGFTIQNITNASGTQTWDNAPVKYGQGLPLPLSGGGSITQDYGAGVLDPSYAYYVIGKSPTESNLGPFVAGTPVALFTFQGNGCFGPIMPMAPGDAFIQAALDTYGFNVPNSFYSKSGQGSSGNQIPLEQYVGNTPNASAVCSVPPTVGITSPANNGTATTSPTVSGTATPGSLVTLTGPGNQTLCTTTASASGTYSCPVSVPAGPNSITAVACDAGGCSSPAVSNFTAVGPPSLTAVQPPVGGTTQPITGTATPGSTVAITGPGNTTLCTTTASVSGTFSCPVSVTTGVTPVTVTASGPGGSTSAPLTLTAVDQPTVGITSPANNGTATTSPTVSGTATPGSLVTLTGPGNQTLCTTTASASGTYSCPVSVPAGPNSITAVACNAGGCSSPAVSNFTAVGPPSLTAVQPPAGGTTQPITGTATPGSAIVITGPGNTTLCTTTASVSGTFSCPVSVTTGVTPVTVTASGPGGSTSAPLTLTAVDQPTVGITSPANNGTATTSPTVSGTATPGSLVTLTGPGNQTLCTTTASASGTYSCPVSAPAGPNSITAVACNAGGCSSPAVSNFTAVGPPSLTAVQPPVGGTTQPITGTATPGSAIVITGPGNTTLCTTTASVSGTFSCPVSVTTGVTPVTVTASGPGGSTSAPLTLTAVAQPTVGITSPANNGTATTSPTVSGTATPGSLVTLTGPGNQTLCTTTASASGTYSCPVSVPAGPNSITAVACNAGGCSTPAVTNFTAVGPPSLTVVQPPVGGTTQPITGTATPGSTVAITGPGNTTLCTTTASVSGTFSCPVSVTTGVTPVTVTASGPGGSTSAPLTLTAVDQPTVGITSPANNGTATTSPTVSGTATPGSLVTLTGPGNQTLCTTTASASGTYSCPVSVPAGPNSITAVACDAGGCSSPAVSNFTAVGPPSLTVVQPPAGGTTQPITGTATPGSAIVITGPGNTTLCTTTASVSGTFSCPVSVTTGVTPVTVTASGPGGSTSAPLTLTAVAQPTVGITSPANNGTATTSPTVSGTATPGSLVTLTGPGNQTLCTTTASASGTYSCPVNVPAGPNSITAVACNAGGCSSPAVSNFTAVGPPSLTVVQPPAGGTTQPITGTATPGSTVAITGPGNTTLCTTTASVSGTFSCPVSVPTGVTPLTVTASGPGGSTTVPITVTATLATPCTTPIPGQVIAAATSPLVVNSSTNSFSYISGNSGTSTRWFIVPSTTASPNSGTGTITGNITFLNAGWYQVIFEETNSNQPAGCSIPGTVQSSLDVYISPLVVPCASPSSSTVLVTPSNGAVAIGGTASFSLTGGQPYQNVQWQVVPSTGSTPIVGTGSTAVVTFSQQGLYRIVFTLTNAGDLTCIPVQSVSSALVAVGLNPCASPSPITIVNTTSSSGTAATGTTQTFQAVGGIPGQMVWKVYPTTGVSSVSGIGGTATLTFSQAGNYVVTFLSVNSSLPLGCTMPTGLANNLGITIVNQPTVAITSPATNGTATTSPTVSGTATPGSVVTLTGPGNTTLCTTTASVSGIYSCPVNVPAGPNSITAVACNAGGCSTPAVTNFTAVGPPSLTVVQPPAGGTTQPITGTATPGSAIVITGPGNTTLCTTTASVSGTFSCPVTVSTGVTPVTVTASGPGGITSVPLSLTANGAPTVSIAGPPGAILTNSPTVSGTATPGSLVTIVGPGNLTLCTTTASANGSYACTVNLPTGPTTLTAIATNSGGTGTATTTVTVTGLVARVYLQGALINAPVAGRMRDDLRVKNLIPTTEPYTSLGFTQTGGGGGETIANPSGVFAVTGANAIVDWVLVELRNANAPTTIVATRSALVQADGDIVSVDGTSPITFGQGVTQGTAYYVSVRHRNHLGVMTASPVSTTASTVPVVDFTNAGTPVYQYPLGNLLRSTAPLATQDGLPALWAGNTFKDNQVVFQGPSNDVDPIFFDVLGDPGNTGGFSNYIRNNVYTVSDVDMNGRVIFQGPSNEVDTIFFEIMTHPDNVVNQYVNFIIRQQLP